VNDPLPGTKKTPREWMNWTTVEYGDPTEVVWLRSDGGGHDAQGPWYGHLAVFRPSSHLFAWGPVADYEPYTTTSCLI
jgi:hypothetical protein